MTSYSASVAYEATLSPPHPSQDVPLPRPRGTVTAPGSLLTALVVRAEESRVHLARSFASDALTRWGVAEDEVDSAVLVVGELAANAALYGGTDMALSLSLVEARVLHIEVQDFGAPCCPPHRHRPGEEDEHGRGLDIVDCLADWTETIERESGRTVHAALRVRCEPVSPRLAVRADRRERSARQRPRRTTRRPRRQPHHPVPSPPPHHSAASPPTQHPVTQHPVTPHRVTRHRDAPPLS